MLSPAKTAGLRKVDDKTLESGRLISKRPIGLLSKREFRTHFHISDNILIHLIDGEALSSIDQSNNVMYFTKEEFVAGLCLLISSLFKQFIHFAQILPTFIHLNAVRVLMGGSILDMLFQLDLSLLEVMFVYTIKMSWTKNFSFSTHIPSLQLVTGLPNSCKDWAKGHVLVFGPWSGLSEGPDGVFFSITLVEDSE